MKNNGIFEATLRGVQKYKERYGGDGIANDFMLAVFIRNEVYEFVTSTLFDVSNHCSVEVHEDLLKFLDELNG